MKWIFAFLLPLQVYAGGLFEPALIYQHGTYDPQNSTTYQFNSLGYGLRLGWNFHELPVAIGGEYFMIPNSNYKSSATSTNSFSANENWVGAFLGFRFERFRLIGSYLIVDNQEFKTSDSAGNSVSDLKDRGKGYKVGIYYDFFQHICLGAEYYNISYDSENSTTLSPQTKKSAIMANLSFPFHFLSGGGGGKERR